MSEDQPYLERYHLKHRLGSGGMGEVWLAYDLDLETDVALKFLNESFSEEDGDILKRETRQARMLSHRHILPVYDFHHRPGERAAISMEYAPGGALWEIVTRETPVLEVRHIAAWMLQACDALGYAHELGIVHRDVKPSNLMLDAGNDLKLADFGLSAKLAQQIDFASKKTIGSRGTLHFASPQIIWNPYESHHSNDIYALGVSIFVLLTGSYPFRDPKRNRWTWDPSNLISMVERRDQKNRGNEPIPESWDYAVARCLAEDPMDRPASMKDLAEMLESEWKQAAPPRVDPGPLLNIPVYNDLEREEMRMRNHRSIYILVVMFAAALGLIAGILWGAFAIFEMR